MDTSNLMVTSVQIWIWANYLNLNLTLIVLTTVGLYLGPYTTSWWDLSDCTWIPRPSFSGLHHPLFHVFFFLQVQREDLHVPLVLDALRCHNNPHQHLHVVGTCVHAHWSYPVSTHVTSKTFCRTVLWVGPRINPSVRLLTTFDLDFKTRVNILTFMLHHLCILKFTSGMRLAECLAASMAALSFDPPTFSSIGDWANDSYCKIGRWCGDGECWHPEETWW